MQTCYLYRRVQNSSNTVNRSKGCLIFEWPQSINTSSVILAAGSVTHFARKYDWKHRQPKIRPDKHSIGCAVDPQNIFDVCGRLLSFWGRLRLANLWSKPNTHTHASFSRIRFAVRYISTLVFVNLCVFSTCTPFKNYQQTHTLYTSRQCYHFCVKYTCSVSYSTVEITGVQWHILKTICL